MRQSLIGLGLGLAIVASLVACSAADDSTGMDDPATCSAHTRPAATTKSAREVSFEADVIPIFQASCSFSSCHGSANLNGVYLGAKGKSVDAKVVRAALLESSPKGVSSMPYVVPSDSSRSYLLKKLDGDFCGVTCKNGNCGERMPKGGDALSPEQIDTIDQWIQNGALQN